MLSAVTSSRSGRRLNASGRARRAKRAAARRNQLILGSALALILVLGAPIAIATRMGAVPTMPGLDSAKSFLAMISDRSPGDRTKAELTKTKKKAAAPAAPKQRALAKVTKPELPKEFVNAISPPSSAITAVPPIATMAAIGPALLTPPVPGGGGGIIIPPQAPPPGGGGGTPGGDTPGGDTDNPPPCVDCTPTPNSPETPPPAVPEPGTWATLLLGFGLSGMMIRRRRRNLAASVTG